MKQDSVLFCWRDRVASRESGLSPTERHVALTLSLYFSKAGDSCWPGQDALVGRTGHGRRTIQRALAGLERAGFIQRELPSAAERRQGKNTRYVAVLPGTGVTVTPVHAPLTTESGVTVTPAESVIESAIDSSECGSAREAVPALALVPSAEAAAGEDGSEGMPADLVSALARLRRLDARRIGDDGLRLIASSHEEDASGTLALLAEAGDPAASIRSRVGWTLKVLADGGHRGRGSYSPKVVAISRRPAAPDLAASGVELASWCGDCDESTRCLVFVGATGPVERPCPRCHPSVPAWCGGCHSSTFRFVSVEGDDGYEYEEPCPRCHADAVEPCTVAASAA